tara:strand:- start:824 stop:1510 length:687 start_codon:yes stop_codon:yes gene_type:complete
MPILTKEKEDINIELWKDWNKDLEALDADVNLEFIDKHPINSAITSPLSENTAMMKERVNMLLSNCTTPPLKIIEFGGGYGNFCRVYSEQVSTSEFTMVDNPAMLKFAKVFLQKHTISASFVPSSETHKIKGKFDMFAAFSSISEVNPDYRSKILKEFLPRSKSMIIGETAKEMGWVKDAISTYFSHIHVIKKTKMQVRHYIIHASNNPDIPGNVYTDALFDQMINSC